MVDYTYTSARVSALENGLLSLHDIESLISCKSEADCIKMLNSFGYEGDSADEIIKGAKEKKEKKISELVGEPEEIEVLFYENTFHNLKAAIKKLYAPQTKGKLYVCEALVSGEEFEEKIKEGNYEALPSYCAGAAKEAYTALLHTGDGRLADTVVDRACLDAFTAFAEKTKHDILRKYANELVAAVNVKIALRSVGGDKELLEKALAPCALISKEGLIKACTDEKSLKEFLSGYGYTEDDYKNIDSLAKKRIMQTLKPEKYKIFSPAPTINYIISLENEISVLRLVLVCKANGVEDEFIKRRVVDSYGI